MNCPLKIFGNTERYTASCEHTSCEPGCAFKTEEKGCLLADGLKVYIEVHKPIKVESKIDQSKKEEVSKLVNVLQQVTNKGTIWPYLDNPNWYDVGF